MITIPFLPELNDLTIEQAADFLSKQGLKNSIESNNWKESFPYSPKIDFYIARSSSHLLIKYCVAENGLRAVNTENHSSVWEDSCVEFFCLLPDGKHYANFEFNCIGTALAAKRISKTEKTNYSDEQMSSILRYSTLPCEPFELKDGDHNWELTVAIPFDLLEIDENNLPESIKANFYKCGDNCPQPHFISWNPITLPKPNFHCPEFFGVIKF